MLLWFSVAILTALAVLTVLWPLSRRAEADDDASHDVAVYRDQLEEVERDVDRGLIEPGEAEAARAEIARRLLRASGKAEATAASGLTRRRAVAVVALVAVPAVALLLYAGLGHPGYPDQPRSARLEQPAGTGDMATLIARVEDQLAKDPDDGRGWEVLAPIYLRMGRANDAVAAYRNALRLQGENAERLSGLGESIVQANGGVVTDEASAAFAKARDLDPGATRPRFFLAMGLSQEGKTDEAIAAWTDLAASAEGGEPWLPFARAQIVALGGEAPPETEPVMPGPRRADVEAAASMSADDRQAMVEGMVSQLATRLDEEGGSVEEWQRLMRAYHVLGRSDAARDAAAKAREAFAGDPEAQARIASTESEIGLNQ
ncbi:c-type cytochrome biogenesis protein CcmI [Amorphus coralli]|uniref:c-type cytochrome biogenesis protein CcmI n=1 Tax=Amorphus coralli TaxID=340680 RepID=UPI0003780B6E|nr:c-type cytochrome biogenesis protein CcmI [Amorphus coralli]